MLDSYFCICMYLLHLGALMYLNEATLLHNVRVRYAKNQIYVSTFLV